MIRGFYTARSGLVSNQEHMSTISNNMANANSVGFKSMRTAFADMIYQNLNREEAADSAMVGHGVRITKNDLLMGVASLQKTDREFDVALHDPKCFFAIENSRGEVMYTRAGNFYLGNEDETFYLVTASGDRVLNQDGDYYEVDFDEDDEEAGFDPMQIAVYRFDNPYGLWADSDCKFAATDEAGVPVLVEEPDLVTGFLESSNTDVPNEMVHMIEASRAFSLNSRMVVVADEIEQTINSLR